MGAAIALEALARRRAGSATASTTLRGWYTHRVLPWSLEARPARGGLLRGNLRRGDRAGGLRRRRRGVHSAGRPRRDLHPADLSDRHADSDGRERHVRARAKDLDTPDTFANTAVAGAYAASFGGFVTPEQRRPGPHLAQGRSQAIRRAIGFASSGRSPTRRCRKGVQTVVVPATSTSGGNAQPIDLLVTDLTGGDPTPYAQKVAELAQKRPGRDQRQQHRHAARAARSRFSSTATRRRRSASISAKRHRPPARRSAATSRRSSRRPPGWSRCR